MPKHTPGPWQCLAKLSGSENHKGYRIVCEKRNTWWLADVSPIDPDGKEGEANARLMAASPELLSALRLAFPLLSDKAAREEIGALLNTLDA